MPKSTPNIWKHPKSGVYYARFEFNGRKYRRSTGSKKLTVAVREARRIRAEIEDEEADNVFAPTALIFLSAIDISHKEAEGHSALHVKRLTSLWAVILKAIGKKTPIHTLTHDRLVQYVAMRRAKKVRGQTIRREIQLIKRAWMIAKRKGLVRRVPEEWPTIKSSAPDKAKSGKYRSPEEVLAYLRELHTDARDEVAFAAMTGLRMGELKRLRFEMIHSSSGMTFIRLPPEATKSRKERLVAVPGLALEILQRRRPGSEDGFVFPRQDFKKARRLASQRAGLEGTATLRDMRHTFAVNFLMESKDPAALLDVMGHRDLGMTQRYLSSTVERAAAGAVGAEKGLQPDTPHRTHLKKVKAK